MRFFLAALIWVFCSNIAYAQSPYIQLSVGSGTNNIWVNVDPPWDVKDKKFHVCEFNLQTPNLQNCFFIDGNDLGTLSYTTNAYPFGATIVFRVKCLCRIFWRTIGDNWIEIPHPIQLPSDAVQFNQVTSGKCIYVHNARVHNWGCWNDPGMAFQHVDEVNSTFKIKDVASGLCLSAAATDGAWLSAVPCVNATRFEYESAGNNTVRIRTVDTGKCVYGTDDDGGKVHVWGCWNDPNFEYLVVSY